MGSPDYGESDELPAHEVTVGSFWIDTTEVTQLDYRTVTGRGCFGFKGDTKPAENITWFDAVEYCNARSRRDGLPQVYNTDTWEADFSKKGYRLPTEAEWEYACRAGSTDRWYWEFDDFWAELEANAWVVHYANWTTQPVAQLIPNAWGLYDMAGNVWEWTNDWYKLTYYEESPSDNPKGPDSGEYRVVRGGSWNLNEYHCRSTRRGRRWPDYFHSNIGFRVVLPAE